MRFMRGLCVLRCRGLCLVEGDAPDVLEGLALVRALAGGRAELEHAGQAEDLGTVEVLQVRDSQALQAGLQEAHALSCPLGQVRVAVLSHREPLSGRASGVAVLVLQLVVDDEERRVRLVVRAVQDLGLRDLEAVRAVRSVEGRLLDLVGVHTVVVENAHCLVAFLLGLA